MKKYAIAIIALLAAASAVSAQQLSLSDKLQIRNDCGPDIQRLCPGVKPGGGELLTCVKDKKAELSKVCSDTLGKLMAKKQD